MTDLTTVLPGFPTQQYARILPSLEKHQVTTTDLLALDGLDIAKRAQVPVVDVKKLCNAVLQALQASLGIPGSQEPSTGPFLRKSGEQLVESWHTISTLDDDLDCALGGGIPTGSITEITGESGAGKTQFLLTLLLSAQLPLPLGLSSSTLYVSTEAALPVTRVRQLLLAHPALVSADPPPSLDRIISIVTPDLESQDHILRYQVPVAIKRHGIRLLVLDSVAANYRAEFERPSARAPGREQNSGANMAHRSVELVKLGQLLRELASAMNISVVVANQVADRFLASSFESSSPILSKDLRNSLLAQKGGDGNLPPSPIGCARPCTPDIAGIPIKGTLDPMSLDHQQRWLTGWGDDPHPTDLALKSLKTPSLGMIWTTQIACRIALVKMPVYGRGVTVDEDDRRSEPILKRWRRWMKVVFATHTAASGAGLESAVEFEIGAEGLRAVRNGNE